MDLTLWHMERPTAGSLPVVAEISFDFQDNTARYSKAAVRDAKKLFSAMQIMDHWVSEHSSMKTAFMYGYDSEFCQTEN